jgi:hypothetical protein
MSMGVAEMNEHAPDFCTKKARFQPSGWFGA